MIFEDLQDPALRTLRTWNRVAAIAHGGTLPIFRRERRSLGFLDLVIGTQKNCFVQENVENCLR